MYIDDKYFLLLNLLIYDKRNKMEGLINKLVITNHFNNTIIQYSAFMNRLYYNETVFVDEFQNGSIVFLLPFGVKYMNKEMEENAKKQEEAIKEFFGDKFREDMIMRISEEERQEEIRKWEWLILGLRNWGNFLEDLQKYKYDKMMEAGD